ncbi:Helicase protein with RING/U-box domain isoform 2 [Hibiscus syriacus]|uniref:Helicase protein with RING/U-box domain isoform 2 n=1 Tax=Hibiscus syriacus TaxID=106335 RepID=A0A6A3CMN6_HIBSY|nr:DNA repair protein RAD16-like [Hibiscus syriacus]KAE8729967.1 Helicase protein with RING/U-box domain isoform 2 [Hibiscus syriacus]
MKLRSRKRISNLSDSDEHSDPSDKPDGPIMLASLSDSEIYVPSSDSDIGEDEILDLNHKTRKPSRITVYDFVEPSTNRGNDEQELPEQNEVSGDFNVSSPKKRKNAKRRKRKKSGEVLMWEVWEEEHEKWVDENLTVDVDLDQQNAVITETSEASSDLIIPLLRYQKEWLAWALKQEDSEIKGGILADEMGMGKTLQAIALVLAKRQFLHEIGDPNGSSVTSGSSTDLPRIRCTLVICPVVAVSQWVSEIDRFTSRGSTKVLVYHGANRGKNMKLFSEYDFVITTYSIVESEYRKFMMPPKSKCPFCGKSFQEKKLSVHLKYFCGPDAVKTLKQSKQESKKSKSMLKSGREHASNYDTDSRKKGSKKKAKHIEEDKDVEYEFNGTSADIEHSLPQGKAPLHSVKWERVILDEAHFVKDRRSNTAKAVLSLESLYKWALSGTPLQNRVGELYSLVRFLQIVPYSYYLCKDCDCRILDYGTSRECSNCPHSSVRHFCWWNKYVATPIQNHGNGEIGKRAMILLKHKILKNIVLRRTKKGRAADLALPPRIISLRRDTMDIKETDYYESLYSESQAQFNTYVQAGTVMNNYAHIFDLLTRLRQAVDHPYLVVYSSTAAQRAGSIANCDRNNDEQVCGICNDPAEDPVVTACEHVFCKACLIDFSASVGHVSCPTCSRLLTVDLTTNADAGGQSCRTTLKGFKSSSILNRIQLNDFQTSTKIEALREEIRFMVERDGSAKGIVFSQFTNFLDLIRYSLHKSGINCVQLIGSMTLGARDAAIKSFTEDPDCKIFLVSLKAGGVALNLTVASHVFLMDPWWNPAVERQAQDRIHRIGQCKPIRIVRFVIENTIEERILKLQEKKELVFEGTVGGSTEALGKLTEADMRFLFVT